jgi:hypothetical protein
MDEDGSEGVLYLVNSDLALDYERMSTIYQRRWKVEEYHKPLKSNASLARSLAKTIRTQSNHVIASLWAFVKLERIKIATKLNRFALRSRLCESCPSSFSRVAGFASASSWYVRNVTQQQQPFHSISTNVPNLRPVVSSYAAGSAGTAEAKVASAAHELASRPLATLQPNLLRHAAPLPRHRTPARRPFLPVACCVYCIVRARILLETPSLPSRGGASRTSGERCGCLCP